MDLFDTLLGVVLGVPVSFYTSLKVIIFSPETH